MVALSVNIILGFVIGILKLNEDFILYMLGISAVSVISMLCASLICAKFCGGMKACIGKYEKKTGLLDNFLLVVLGFSGCMTVNFIINLISMFIPMPGSSDIPLVENMDIYNIIFMQLAIAVSPAICEELAFRGFAMGGLADFGNGFAILVSSVLFGMMHNGVSGVLFAFSVGLMLGCIRKTSGSLIPSMIVHFLNNAYSVTAIVISKSFNIELFANISTIFVLSMCVLFVIMLVLVSRRNIGFFTFSSGDCVLTKSEKAKIIFTSPVFWALVAFSALINIISLVGAVS